MLYLDSMDLTKKVDSYLYYRGSSDFGYVTYPRLDNQELILTQNRVIQELFPNSNIKILSEFIGIKEGMGLYELFSYFFDGKVKSDFDMIEALFNGFVVDSDWCFCLKVGVTFCWFRVEARGIQKLGTMQFSEQVSKYTIGKFMKRLRYSILMSGVN